MSCDFMPPIYMPGTEGGINLVVPHADGYTTAMNWDKAYPPTSSYVVAYNIYFSTEKESVFTEGPKYVSTSANTLKAEITELTVGDTYYFAVKAFAYQPSWMNLNRLPDGINTLKTYPEAVLRYNITDLTLNIPITDIQTFPSYGIVLIGAELIQYSNVDLVDGYLIASSIDDRGFLGTTVSLHNVDGYDGTIMRSPIIKFWAGAEEDNEVIMQATPKFAYPYNAFTNMDGYKTVTTDILTTDLTETTDSQGDFRTYDFKGWHRRDPKDFLNGGCVGSYIGGEYYCADGYGSVGGMLRNIPVWEATMARQEVLLDQVGEPVVLMQRQRTGIRCSCFIANMEHPEARCPKCYGVGFVVGYNQFINSRRSDSRIMIRFEPATDDLKLMDDGLESEFNPECWTLAIPPIKDRDIIIRYDRGGAREYTYEVMEVTRNVTLYGYTGVQKFKVSRVRKTDILYQVKAVDNTATLPQSISTSIAFMRGPGNTMLPHTHSIMISENILTVSQINQTTSMSEGHSHIVQDGVVIGALGHTHNIVL